MSDMPVAAKRYAYAVITVGGLILALSLLLKWSPNSWISFGVYFTLSIIASMVKFTPPGINGTYSVSFLLTLAGIAEFTLPETLIATCAGALIQSLWKVKQRPSAIQVLFSMANLTISTSLCFVIAHSVLVDGLQAYRPAVLALVAAIHFAMSTVLVSGVLALLRGQPLIGAAVVGLLPLSFPYYLVGAAASGLMIGTARSAGWPFSFLVLPILTMIYVSYRLHARPKAVAAPHA